MNILKNIFSKKYINKYNKKLSYLGLNNKLNLVNFLVSRLILTIVLFVLCLFIPKYGLLIALLVSIMFYYLYTLLLIDNKINKRSDKLYDEALLLFSMLKLSLNTTKDIKVSLETVVNKIGNSLALEFRRMLENNKYNNDINYVFNKVIDTIPNNDVRKSLIDLKESNYDVTSIDNIINELKDKHLILIRQSNQYKPLLILFIGLLFLIVIVLMILNINEIISYFNTLV